MTVIAYSSKHKIIAADSRLSDEIGMHVTNCQKLFRLRSGAVLGTAGDSDDRDVRELLGKVTLNKLPRRVALAELECTFAGIMAFPRGRVFTINIWQRESGWAGSLDEIHDAMVAIGCGAQFAYGAMEAGASPIAAVQATCRRHAACALPVQWEAVAP
jgi:20S proteasome alpha/beta subunit